MRQYGRLFPDPQHEAVHRVISCDPGDSFVVDLDFVDAKDPDPLEGGSPVVQVGFDGRGGVGEVWARCVGREAARWCRWVSGEVCGGAVGCGVCGWRPLCKMRDAPRPALPACYLP